MLHRISIFDAYVGVLLLLLKVSRATGIFRIYIMIESAGPSVDGTGIIKYMKNRFAKHTFSTSALYSQVNNCIQCLELFLDFNTVINIPIFTLVTDL